MDPHDVLNLPKNGFTIEQLRYNYKSLARQLHPDKRTMSEAEATHLFQILTDAYRKLVRELEDGQPGRDFAELREAARASTRKDGMSGGGMRGNGFDVDKFNTVFSEHRTPDPVIDGGYGRWMEQTDPGDAESRARSNALVVRRRDGQEPEAASIRACVPFSEIGVDVVSDYSRTDALGKALLYTDYRIAHSTDRLADKDEFHAVEQRSSRELRSIDALLAHRGSLTHDLSPDVASAREATLAAERERESRRLRALSDNPGQQGGMVHTMISSAVNGGCLSANAIKGMLLYDASTRFLPAVLKWVGSQLERFARRHASRVTRLHALSPKKAIRGSIVLQRNYESDGDGASMFDAVLSLASTLPNANKIRRTNCGIFLVETDAPFELAPDVLFRKVSVTDKDGTVSNMQIEVFSYALDLTSLRDFLDATEAEYARERENALGRQLYYFDELPVIPPMMRDSSGEGRTPDLSKAPRHLTFTMFPLHSNKSMRNMYGSSTTTVRRRVDFFIKNPSWYREKGIPHTLGILLHGSPGCGKTSLIKALSRDTRRHVVNLKLGSHTTIQQLNDLFYNSKIHVVREGVSSSYNVPIDRRILVLEDVDCLSDVVLSRDEESSVSNNPYALNLSVLLNLLDGVLETPGRILLMTSNHPERLDSALVRPGRIDVMVNFKKCSPADIIDMVDGICDVKLDRADVLRKLAHVDGLWTPAEVTKVIFDNVESPERAIESLSPPPSSPPVPLVSHLPPPSVPPPSSDSAKDGRAAVHPLLPTPDSAKRLLDDAPDAPLPFDLEHYWGNAIDEGLFIER
ncbi:hypothetical protein CEUSTIGMA_g11922.t1 [Chlamydomonas eustigma]|uniref:J domain-containing protein n=1 Tax=Chlamydomonas eustigma TaxID=1157962 RepID=A0A250XNL4_9CHLO|nr:hypothetical protein CEUSTIGMA_g11922.t1 [Chlamydomonas eustigma]|eukprot:GAX84502.1 hypothetical protein CEUSTIGMA_g11922.t1 [Chlamydomonas eustigma]